MTKSPSKGNFFSGVTRRPDGVLEKRTPHHDLATVQATVSQLGAAAFTRTALDGGRAMDLTSAEMLATVSRLGRANFYKSMTCYGDENTWQDVYHAAVPDGKTAYIKFILRGYTPVIQFKEK